MMGKDGIRMKDLMASFGYEKSYYDVYQEYFDRSWTRILELGVGAGQSLRTYKSWFPNAKTIYAVDNNEERKLGAPYYVGPKSVLEFFTPEELDKDYTIFIGDERDEAFMKSVAEKVGPMDLIIDDASHEGGVQRRAFNLLQHLVAPGGLYCVEDIYDPTTTLERQFGGSD